MIYTVAPVVFEPVDEGLEGREVLFVEEEAAGFYSNELLDYLFFGNIGKHQVLGIVRQHAKPVRDFSRIFLLFIEYSF